MMIVEGIVVDQNQALRFALDVARGMEFLHSMEPLIPNLTLNSKHIMVILPQKLISCILLNNSVSVVVCQFSVSAVLGGRGSG